MNVYCVFDGVALIDCDGPCTMIGLSAHTEGEGKILR